MAPEIDLSVVMPAHNEGPNLVLLIPEMKAVLAELGLRYEILVVCRAVDAETARAVETPGCRALAQKEPGYGGALVAGFAEARGEYILTCDADLSHRPSFIRDLWRERASAGVLIASRYVPGGKAIMPRSRYLLSRTLNVFFSRGLSLKLRDMSSGFRLYRAAAVRGQPLVSHDFNVLQEILVRIYAQGWRVREVPFTYCPREHGASNARIFRFGLAYLKSFPKLWKLRNAITCADYDDRAFDSVIPLQRYWQRRRLRLVTELVGGQGPVLAVGAGSSRMIAALPEGSFVLDAQFERLRYVHHIARRLAQVSAPVMPVQEGGFSCVLCWHVIERLPKQSPVLDQLDRVLAPGGVLVLLTPDHGKWQWNAIQGIYNALAPNDFFHHHIARYTRRELVQYFAGRGYRVEAVRYILGGELILALRKGKLKSKATHS